MHKPLSNVCVTTDGEKYVVPYEEILADSPEANLAFEMCDGTAEDYFAKLCQVHDLFDELSEGLSDWLDDHGIEFADLVSTIAGVREAEATAEVDASKDTGPQVRTAEARAAIRRLFLAGLDPAEMADVLGLEGAAVEGYLDRTGFDVGRREALALDRQGVPRAEIARRLGKPRQWVYDTLNQAGVQIGDGKTYSESQRRAVVRGYKAGRTIAEIGEKYGLKKATVINILRSAKAKGELPEYPRSGS